MQKNKVKPLKDLRLLDRFLFAEVMDDPECSKEVLKIILGKDIQLLPKNQTEKRSPDRFVAEIHSSGCLLR